MMRRLALAIGGAILAIVIYLATLHLTGNFHVVIAGEVYRSGQMGPDDLARWKEEHGLRSVVNLRGENSGNRWYDEETEAARRHGLAHFDFRMSAQERLAPEQAAELMRVLAAAPKPVLVHCNGGADRTGLASALYLAGIAGGSEADAEWQLSLRYGHVGVPWLSKAWPMDQTWETLEPWLGIEGS
jgi:protein tyrosine/serine phosphatase